MKICPVCATPIHHINWHCEQCGWSAQSAETNYVNLLTSEGQSEIEGYRDEFFAPLAQIEKGHFWFEARNRVILWALKTYFSSMQSFLEIGCGTGFVLSSIRTSFPDIQLCGAEYYGSGLAFARKRIPSAEFYQLDARSIPFKDEFDVIGAFDVIEHIKEDEQVLSEMYGAVRAGGGIILTVPQHKSLWSVADEYKQHERRYDRQELIDRVEAAGFEVMHTTSFVTFLLPVMLLSRLIQNRYKQRAKQAPDRMTELDISPVANTLLKPVMAIETAAVRRHIRLPAGGSLLLVARKP